MMMLVLSHNNTEERRSEWPTWQTHTATGTQFTVSMQFVRWIAAQVRPRWRTGSTRQTPSKQERRHSDADTARDATHQLQWPEGAPTGEKKGGAKAPPSLCLAKKLKILRPESQLEDQHPNTRNAFRGRGMGTPCRREDERRVRASLLPRRRGRRSPHQPEGFYSEPGPRTHRPLRPCTSDHRSRSSRSLDLPHRNRCRAYQQDS